MKQFLTRVFWPILAPFEKGDSSAHYRPSHRKALLGMGFLFLVLAGVSAYISLRAGEAGGLAALVVFGGVGLVSWVVGFLGSDTAVARIWGNR
mgnify:FL=1